MSTISDTFSLPGATAASAGSAATRPAGVLRTTWRRIAAVSTTALVCLQEATYLSHATSRADLARRIRLLERPARDRNF